MSELKYSLFISLFLLAVFVLAVAVWCSPALFKGYPAYTMSINALMGRNIHLTGLYSAENDLNVFLASNLIEEQGRISIHGNKLTSLLYGKIFKTTGLPDENNFVLLSVFIYALTLLIFTGTVLYLFKFKTAAIFALIYIFLPFNWKWPYHLGIYEFALLFLSLFFLFYLYGIRQKNSHIYLVIAGTFLALSCLSREALLLIVPFLLVFLLIKKQKRYLLCIFIPFTILFAIFWLPNLDQNAYMQLFFNKDSSEVETADFTIYSHLYPDPYTYHFEQKEFLADLQNKVNNNEVVLMKELDKIKELKNVGAGEISLFDRMKVSSVISSRHIFRFVSLEDIGGPFILLLILLGLYSLRQKNKYLFQFFVYWILSALFLMSFIVLAVRNHLVDFNWAIALLTSLGVLTLSKVIISHFNLTNKKALIIYIIILLAVFYNFVLVSHVFWSRIYDNSNNLMVKAYSQEIKKLDILDHEVIAVNLDTDALYNLNYLVDKSVVLFQPETVENLLKENELDWAFEQFKVKYILGYSNELTEEIVGQIEIVNIASDSLEPAEPEMSRNKGWLMNLIK